MPYFRCVAYGAARAENRRFIARYDGCGIRLPVKKVFNLLVTMMGIDNDGAGTGRDQTPNHDIQQWLPVQREQRFGGVISYRGAAGFQSLPPAQVRS